MQIEKREVESNLPRKGFVKDDTSHHIYFNHVYNGKPTGAYTFVSHSATSIGDVLISKMKKQLRLNSSRQVYDLVKCTIDGDKYIELAGRNLDIDR